MRRIFLLGGIIYGSNAQTISSVQPTHNLLSYLEYLPADYNLTTEKSPCIFFLNVSDEVGNGLEPDIWKIVSHSPPTEINVSNKHNNSFKEHRTQECFVVIGVQAGCLAFISFKDFPNPHIHIIDNYKIEPEGINETGFGMGEESAYKLAAICSPTKIAALEMNTGTSACETAKVVVFSAIPVWYHHGGNEGNMVTIQI